MAVPVPVEQDALGLAFGTLGRLDPLAPSGAFPQCLDESDWTTLHVRTIVRAHDFLDGLRGFVGIIEGNGGYVVVEYMGLDDAMEHVATDETELAVNGGRGSAGEVPRGGLIVRERRVGVLQESNGH